MARKSVKASKAKPRKTSTAKSKATPTNGSIELRDSELRALALNHKGLFERALAAKKAKDADFRNCCKKIKSELGNAGVTIIKAMIEFDSEEGEAAVIERIRSHAKAARWAGLPIGTQIEFSLGEPDRTPAVDRAFDEGKMASMESKPRKCSYDPSTPQYKSWMDGYAEDQTTRAAKIGTGNGEEKHVRPRHLREREAERQIEEAAKPH